MTDRSDIDTRLVYSCNCGWIDKGHATIGRFRSPNADPAVGAINLWKQMKGESYPTNDTINGSPCFRVIYKQSMGTKVSKNSPFKAFALPDRSLFKVSSSGYYLVRKGLPLKRKEEVALRIFLDVSYGFESMQASFPFFLGTDSGYSQEDLVSNLIGFYAAVKGLSDAQIEQQLCKVVSKKASLDVWDKYIKDAGIGETKNKGYSKPNFYACSQCKGKPQFPQIFTSIKRANYGGDFIRYQRNSMLPIAPVRNFDSSGKVIN